MEKSTHGFPFLLHDAYGLRLAALRATGAPLLNDKDYVTLVNSTYMYEVWVKELKNIDNPRLFWDLVKYKIGQDIISYRKRKARERKAKMADLDQKI